MTVANQESISAAANYLHLSQPTLSRQLNDLEKELGTTLFIRGNRKISLTDEGVFLLEKAKEIVGLVDKTEANFNQPAEIISGEIYIGGGETESMHIIAKTLKEILTKHPSIKFHPYSGNADDVTAKIDSGLLDFGIVIEPVDKQKYDYIQLPATDVWGVLMLRTSPLAAKPVIQPKDLIDKPLITSRQIGYALCIDGIINTSGNSELYFRPLSPKLEAGLNITWKKHQVFSNVADKFLEQLRKIIKT